MNKLTNPFGEMIFKNGPGRFQCSGQMVEIWVKYCLFKWADAVRHQPRAPVSDTRERDSAVGCLCPESLRRDKVFSREFDCGTGPRQSAVSQTWNTLRNLNGDDKYSVKDEKWDSVV